MGIKGYSVDQGFDELISFVNSYVTLAKLCPSENYVKSILKYKNNKETHINKHIEYDGKECVGSYYYKMIFTFSMKQNSNYQGHLFHLEITDGIGVIPRVRLWCLHLVFVPKEVSSALEEIFGSLWQKAAGNRVALAMGDYNYENVKSCFAKVYNCLENEEFNL
ncbi:hypothetical protein D3C81_544260 [compost metagenome]